MSDRTDAFRKLLHSWWVAGFMILLVLLLAGDDAYSQTSQQMTNVQGRLFGNAGNPVPDGNYNMTFRLYDAAGGGVLLFTEGPTPIAATNGYYNHNLGSVTLPNGIPTSVFTNASVWLEIQIVAETLAPRTRIVSSAYAYNADMLDGYHAGNANDNVPVSNGTVNTNLNADLLDGQSGGFYQNASNINAGTLGVGYLPADVCRLSLAQTFTANKTFNTTSNLYFDGGVTYYVDSDGNANFFELRTGTTGVTRITSAGRGYFTGQTNVDTGVAANDAFYIVANSLTTGDAIDITANLNTMTGALVRGTVGLTSTANLLNFVDTGAAVKFRLGANGLATYGGIPNPDPAGSAGMFYYNSTSNVFRWHNGTLWQDVGAAGGGVGGGGTLDYLARWTALTTLGNGATRDDGTYVAIGTAPVPTNVLTVTGSVSTAAGSFTNSSATNGNSGVFGEATGNIGVGNSIGVYGRSTSAGTGGKVGVQGIGQADGGTKYGVLASAVGTGTNFGVAGSAVAGSGTTNYGVYGSASLGTTNWAGYFQGNCRATGRMEVGTPTIAATNYAEDFDHASFSTGWTNGSPGWVFYVDGAGDATDTCIGNEDIGDNQNATVSLAITGLSAGTIFFSLRTASEIGADFLYFYIDGIPQGSWSDQTPWTTVGYAFAAGDHTFMWRYEKDPAITSYSDTVWIDSVVISGFNPSAADGNLFVQNKIYANSNAVVGDIAEYMEVAEGPTMPGTVVSIDSTSGMVVASKTPYDPNVIGVISHDPSVVLNSPASGVPVALVGRVKVRMMVAPGDEIRPGDPITTSYTPGIAMKATASGNIIGLATTGLKGQSGNVMVLLQPGRWYERRAQGQQQSGEASRTGVSAAASEERPPGPKLDKDGRVILRRPRHTDFVPQVGSSTVSPPAGDSPARIEPAPHMKPDESK